MYELIQVNRITYDLWYPDGRLADVLNGSFERVVKLALAKARGTRLSIKTL